MPDIKKRGRWLSDSSVRRYEKAARVGARLRDLKSAVLARILRCESGVSDILSGRAANCM